MKSKDEGGRMKSKDEGGRMKDESRDGVSSSFIPHNSSLSKEEGRESSSSLIPHTSSLSSSLHSAPAGAKGEHAMSWDTYRGTITMPDGRQCKATLYGANAPDSWDEPGHFEERENEPLEAEWMDGTELTADDFNVEYTVLGAPRYGGDWIVDQLFKHGDFEHGEYEYD
jgi:hypothetical protein